MAWAVQLAKKADRALEDLPPAIYLPIRHAIDELAKDPFQGDVLPLHGKQWKGFKRKRVGDYRIIFTLSYETHLITIHAVVRRSEKTYR